VSLPSVPIAGNTLPSNITTSAGFKGSSLNYAREDHVHPYSGGNTPSPYTSVPPAISTTEGSAGTSDDYARGNHTHFLDLTDISLEVETPVLIRRDYGGTTGKRVISVLKPLRVRSTTNNPMLYIRIPKPATLDTSITYSQTEIIWNNGFHVPSVSYHAFQYTYKWTFIFDTLNNILQWVVIDYSKSERQPTETSPMKIYKDTQNKYYIRWYDLVDSCRIDEISTSSYFSENDLNDITTCAFYGSSTPPEGFTEYTTYDLVYVGIVEDLYPIGSYVITDKNDHTPDWYNYKYRGMTFSTSPITLTTGMYAWKRIAPPS
jgi:hypothetical protein